MDESFWPNESESFNSRQLSLSSSQGLKRSSSDKLDRKTAKLYSQHAGIWRKLREQTQKRDLQLYNTQQATDLTMSEKHRLDKEGTQLIKQFGLDALSLLTLVNYEVNMQRKQLIKPEIGKDCAALCSPHVSFKTSKSS